MEQGDIVLSLKVFDPYKMKGKPVLYIEPQANVRTFKYLFGYPMDFISPQFSKTIIIVPNGHFYLQSVKQFLQEDDPNLQGTTPMKSDKSRQSDSKQLYENFLQEKTIDFNVEPQIMSESSSQKEPTFDSVYF